MSTARNRAPSTTRQHPTAVQLREQAVEQAATLIMGADWTRLLRYLDHFRGFGATNALLILRNRPHATELATYEQWRACGRQVKRGEHGLTLIAPGDPRGTIRLFDITQTGAPPTAGPLTHLRPPRHSPRDLESALTSIATRRGFTIDRAFGSAPASTIWPDRTIHVHPVLTDEAACYALAHELAHILQHDGADFPTGTARCSGVRFVEAESAAFLVCRAAGIDVNAFTFPPPPTWAGVDPRTDSGRVILAAAERIAKTSRSLNTHIDAINDGRARHPIADRPRPARAGGAFSTQRSTRSEQPGESDERRAGQPGGAGDSGRPEESGQPQRAPGVGPRVAAESPSAAQPLAGSQRSVETAHGAEAEQRTQITQVARPPSPSIDARQDPALYEIHAAAERFFVDQLPGSWVPGYLASRGLAAALGDDAPWGIGYAPATWTALVDHLRAHGHTEDQIIASGLGKRSRTGGLIDRFRDRAMIPVRSPDGTTIAFIGRAAPEAAPTDGNPVPKYLNSPQTPLYTKGAVLYGLDIAGPRLTAGATPVLVEGTLDAIAVATADTKGRYAPVAPSGTALTRDQVTALADAADLTTSGVLVAFDGDPAGQRAASRAHGILRYVTSNLRRAVLPAGADPADLLKAHGPQRLTAALGDQRPLAELVVDAHLAETADQRPWERRDEAAALIGNLTAPAAATAIRNADTAGTGDPLTYAHVAPAQAARLLPATTLALIMRVSASIAVPAEELTNAVVTTIAERPSLQREPRDGAGNPAALAGRDTPHGLTTLRPATSPTIRVPGTTRLWTARHRTR